MVIKSGSLENDHVYTTGQSIQPGTHVVLSSSNVCIIGKGIILPGDMLHGSAIPESYVKVSLSFVVHGIKPLLKTSFDDDSDELSQEQIIGWPIDIVHMQ